MKKWLLGVGSAVAVVCLAAPAFAATKTGTDREGARFQLSGRVLTVRLVEPETPVTPSIESQVFGKRVRASCGLGGTGNGVAAFHTRRWPRAQKSLTYRFPLDISRRARWCVLENPSDGVDIAFARLAK